MNSEQRQVRPVQHLEQRILELEREVERRGDLLSQRTDELFALEAAACRTALALRAACVARG